MLWIFCAFFYILWIIYIYIYMYTSMIIVFIKNLLLFYFSFVFFKYYIDMFYWLFMWLEVYSTVKLQGKHSKKINVVTGFLYIVDTVGVAVFYFCYVENWNCESLYELAFICNILKFFIISLYMFLLVNIAYHK